MDFTEFVLSHLPPPPARILDVGCGREGGTVPALVAAGYDAFGADPRAPEGERYAQATLDDVDATYDAVVAARVLHHVHPLEAAVAKLASLAPLVVVDEFAHERLDDATRAWYEGQHRMLALAGSEPPGPPDLGEWRAAHAGLHPSSSVLDALGARFEQRALVDRPYLCRWLGGPTSEALEQMLVDTGAIPALGWFYAGTRTDTTRSSAASR